jgi:pimeloyl-ACP methyl ester carboxylesterase
MGSKDPDFKNPEAEAKRVAEAVRGSYKIIENAGHYPHAEMPEVTAPLVLNFLRSLSMS